jgi:hypothetical protein
MLAPSFKIAMFQPSSTLMSPSLQVELSQHRVDFYRRCVSMYENNHGKQSSSPDLNGSSYLFCQTFVKDADRGAMHGEE